MRKVMILLFTAIALVACSNDNHTSLYEDAEIALDAGDFEKALKLYEEALEADKDNQEIAALVDGLKDYEQLQTLVEEEEWKKAGKLTDDLLANDAIFSALKEALEDINEELTEKETEALANKAIKDIEKLIKDGKFEKAEDALFSLEDEYSDYISQDRVAYIYEQIGDAKEKEAAKKEEEKEINQKEEQAKSTAKKEATPSSADSTSNYVDRVLAIQANADTALTEAQNISTEKMVNTTIEYYDQLDKVLNEVWGVLKNQMSADAFNTLKAEQNEWIIMKENAAKDAANNAISDDDAVISKHLLLQHYTAERTIYLVDNYM